MYELNVGFTFGNMIQIELRASITGTMGVYLPYFKQLPFPFVFLEGVGIFHNVL
jgi:hypothetical protein